jgi:endonuclease/exonuclease/phosphatase family metal-dependent hydrolase
VRDRSGSGPALTGLVAALTVVTLELVRFSGPLLDSAFSRGGAAAVAGVAVLTYAAPAPTAALLLVATRRAARPWPAAVLAGTIALGLLRLVVQGLRGEVRVVVGLGAVAVSVAVLVLAVTLGAARSGSGRAPAGAVLSGAAGSTGLQLALGTWDAGWRHTVLGWAVAAALVVLVVLLAVLVALGEATAPGRPTGLWSLGPALALGAMMLANPAFAAAQSGLPLLAAGPLLGLGLLSGAVLVTALPLVSRPSARRWSTGVAAAALLAGTAVALQLSGATPLRSAAVVTALVAAQLGAALLLARSWSPPAADLAPARPVRTVAATAATAGVVGLSTIGPLLLFQLHYDVPLGVPNAVVLVATAASLAWAGSRRAAGADPTVASPSTPGPPGGSWAVLVAGVLVVLGSVVALPGPTARQPAAAVAARYTGRVVSWNLHYGVSPAGGVDLEGVARVIEASDPDVVLLQEVSRGWVQGGGVDTATWLAERLDRTFVFAPAADGRFGNVVLARGPLTDVRVQPLPFGAGPQRRSAVTAVTRLGTRQTAVTSLHLQHRAVNTPTRLAQLETFLAAGTGAPQVVGGDLNATPGSAEVRRLTGVGYVSAVDAVGDRAALTDPSTAPTRRIDWVLGRGIDFTGAEVVTDVVLSDHLPLVVAVAP